MPRLLYLIAERADGAHDYGQIAEEVSQAFGRGLAPEQVQYLVQEKLAPLGVLAGADGAQPEVQRLDPLLALKFRTAVVPPSLVNAVTTIFRPLFLPGVVVAVLGTLVALDVWLFGFHGVAQPLRRTLYDPVYLLILLGLVILSAAFHECGHATACRYGGAKPGAMGVGIYLVWPAFYTDVTDAYRLGKGGRLRTDLGGVYFNVIFILATAAAYFATGFEPLLLVIPIQHIEILHQFLPFIRLDGYYIISDLTGVPDMFARIKPALKSLVPGRKPDPRVAELKPWVRLAVSGYVLTVIPVLLVMFGLMVMNAPRIFATAWDSFFVQYHTTSHAAGSGDFLRSIVGGIQMGVLALPTAGMVASFSRFGRRIGVGAWTVTAGRPVARAALVAATASAAAFTGYTWWPNGEYKPIQRGERGTIQGGIAEFSHVGSGRPALTKQREQELGGAPMQSSQQPGEEPAPGSTTPTTTQQEQTTPTTTEPSSSTAPATTSTEPSTTTSPTSTDTTSTGTTPTTTTP